MNEKLLKNFLLTVLVINGFITYGQSQKQYLVAKDQQSFTNSLITQKSGQPTLLKISESESLELSLTIKEQTKKGITLIGSVNNQKSSTFSLSSDNRKLSGDIVLPDQKKAYKIFTEPDGRIFIKEINIDKVLCIDFEKAVLKQQNKSNSTPPSKMSMTLESLPGAPGIIYLDFDGEVVSGTRWVNGREIDAKSPNFSDARILNIWKIMAEDFRPFNLNVTTRRDLFDAAPRDRRMMCIFTPTSDAAPGSGGVAYIRSFSSTSFDDPCWVYNIGSSRAAGETGSHEVGHTLGLAHDSQGGTEYYAGHGSWSPIMGWSVNKAIGQWSQGEFENSNQTQDDIAVIGDDRNGFGFQNDDHGNTINNATSIKVNSDGEVNSNQNFGLINNRNDKDVFSFVTKTGDVSFTFNPDPDYPNLNIQARIMNALGEEVAFSDLSGLNASITTNLPGGTYFIEIDGVGEGTPFTGYSDYASLGNYFISGTYQPGNNLQPPVANFEASKSNCSTISFKSTTINSVASYLWNFGDGNTSIEQNPTHEYKVGGSFTVSLTATNEVGDNTNEKSSFITINLPDQPAASNQNICPGESVTLTTTGNSEYQWYNQPTGGSIIATGSSYETPSLDTSKTYYISGIIGECVTNTRTEVKAIVLENPIPPVISVNQDQKLSIDSEFSKYQWYFEGEAIADGNQAQYLPQKKGNYSVQIFNEADCDAISEVFNVDQSQLNLSTNSKKFTVHPNPVKSDELLKIEGITSNDYDLLVIDILGQTVIKSLPKSEVDISALSKGLYIILVNNKPIGKFIRE